MADKKYIRDLNSLIRINPRKRLKAPPLKNSISGGRGLAELGKETPTDIGPTAMYMRHYDSGSNLGVIYKYLPDGSTPTLEFDYSPREIGLGVVDDAGIIDVYCGSNGVGNAAAGAVYKNDNLLVAAVGPTNIVSSNSSYVITQDDNYTMRLYDYAGAIQSTIALPTTSVGSVQHFTNNHGVVYHSVGTYADDDEMSVADFSGNLIVKVPKVNSAELYYLSGGSESAFYLVDTDVSFTKNEIGVYSKSGVLAGTYSIDNKYFVDVNNTESCIGYTDTHLFVFIASTGQSYCDIYEHTLTIDGSGEVTNAVLGAKVATVNSPVSGNRDWVTWESATASYEPS